MARNSQQLWEAIAKEEQTIATATSEMTRRYARERRSYLLGELILQREHEANREQTIARLEKHLATMETATGKANIQAQIDDERGELALQREYETRVNDECRRYCDTMETVKRMG